MIRRVATLKHWNWKKTAGISVAAAGFFCAAGCAAMDAEKMSNPAPAAADAPAAVQVGAYYYPWYKLKTKSRILPWNRAMRLLLKHRQEPMLGLYQSDDPAVIAGHIEQSLRAGIKFWAVSWWGPGSPTDRVFRKNILPHPDSSKLKYAVLYESTGRFGTFDSPDYSKWRSDLKYMKKHFFNHPSYLRIQGRPVLFVYLSREYFRNRGGEALKQLREEFPEVYLVGDDVYFGDGMSEYLPEWAEQFDAVTSYDIYGQSVGMHGGTQKAVDYLSKNYAAAKQTANSVGTAFIPAIAPGYNDTAVRDGHPGRARYFTDREDSKEGDIFRAMIRQAALPYLDPASDNIMMITSFNEWYEDSQIEPTAGTAEPSRTDFSDSGTYYTGGQWYHDYGYLYLDILREEVKQYFMQKMLSSDKN